jgi:4-amino-4-deoxychorismate lyase
MSQFFESIRVKDGIAEQLGFHQLRVNKTLKAFDASNHSIELASIVQQLVLPADGLFKLKISYDLNGNYQSAFTPYQYKQIQNFALVDIKEQSYDYKFSNRDWINEALIQSGKDEIMMHDGGLIKDCSYTNIVFYDGVNWYTPAVPLLEGTQRAKLIEEGIIQPKALYVQDIPNFKKFKCINAMLNWNTALEYEIELIKKYFP